MKRLILSVSVILIGLPTSTLLSQPRYSFEAASIKAVPATTRVVLKDDASLIEDEGVTMETLVASSYREQAYRVIGPDWIKTAKFNISAKLPSGNSRDHLPEMMQTLLEDRFKLTVHREARELKVYALTVGSRGPKLTPRPNAYVAATDAMAFDPSAHPLTLDAYANNFLSLAVGSPVVDITELKGEYMMNTSLLMKVVRERRLAGYAAAKTGISDNSAVVDLTNSPVFDIVEALGLKLESRKLLLSVIVIDHVENTPSEN